jgi:hypothetical protein
MQRSYTRAQERLSACDRGDRRVRIAEQGEQATSTGIIIDAQTFTPMTAMQDSRRPLGRLSNHPLRDVKKNRIADHQSRQVSKQSRQCFYTTA